MASPSPTTPPTHNELVKRQSSVTANLPLTTIFTADSSCLNRVYGLMTDGTISGQPTAFRDYSLADSACYPSSMFALQYSTNLFYSPGVCPSGWGKASQQVQVGTGSLSRQSTLAWCCPSSMAFSDDGTYAYCSTFVATSTRLYSGGVTTAVPFSNFVGLQWPISVEWMSSDLSKFTPASAPILAAASTPSSALPSLTGTASSHSALSSSASAVRSTSTASSGISSTDSTGSNTSAKSSSRTHTATASSTPSSAGLSTGAQAGIGVGVGVLALALILIGIWLFIRRRNRNKRPAHADAPREDGAQPYLGGKAELPAEAPLASQTYPKEKQDRKQDEEIAELEPQRDGLNELPAETKISEPAELEGSTIGPHAAAEAPTIASPVASADQAKASSPTRAPLASTGETEAQRAARRTSRDPLVNE